MCRLRDNCQMLSRISMPDCGMTDKESTCWLATSTDLIEWLLLVPLCRRCDQPPPGGKCHSVFSMMSTLSSQCRCGTLNPPSSRSGYVIDPCRRDLDSHSLPDCCEWQAKLSTRLPSSATTLFHDPHNRQCCLVLGKPSAVVLGNK